MSADKLLRAVQSGQIRLEDLNDEGKNELRGYMRSNFPSIMGVSFQEESDHITSKTGVAPSFDVGDSPLMKQVNSYTPPITKKTQIQNEREESGKWFDEHGLGFVRKNVLDPVAKGLDWLRFDTSPGQFIDRASQATAEAAGQQRLYEPVSTGSKWVDKTADIVGNIAAPFVPIGGVGTSAANLYKDPLAELASLKMASKVTNPTISKMVQEGTKEALVGAPMMAQYNISRTADSGLSDGLMGGLEGGVGGFVGGAAVGGLGAGLSKLMKKPEPTKTLEPLTQLKSSLDETAPAAEPSVLNSDVDAPGLIKLTPDEIRRQQNIEQFQMNNNVEELPDTRSHIVTKTKADPLKERMSGSLGTLYTKTVDNLYPLKKLDDAIKKVTDINPEEEVHKLALNSRGSDMVAKHMLTENFVDINGEVVGESFKGAMKGLDNSKFGDFEDYLIAKHAETRMKRGEKVYADNMKMSPEKAAAKTMEYEQLHPEFKEISERLYQYRDNLVQKWLVEPGIITPEQAAQYRTDNPFYVPNMRYFSPMEKPLFQGAKGGFMNQKNPIKRATGSERKIISPIESMIEQTDKYVKIAKRNQVGQAVLSHLERDPEAFSAIAKIVDDAPEDIHAIMEKEGVDGVLAMLEKTTDKTVENGNIVTVMVNGKPVKMEVFDEDLFNAMGNLQPRAQNIVVAAMGQLTRVTKLLTTGVNPIFSLTRNVLRDIPTAYINSKSTNNPIEFSMDLIKALKSVVTNDESLQAYKAVGGGHSSSVAADRNLLAQSKNALVPQKGFKPLLTKGLHALENLNNAVETAPRLGEFNRTLRKGGSKVDALYQANDVTVNFNKYGEYSKNVDAFVPYFNAAIQGLDKVGRMYTQDPKKAIVKTFAAVTIPTIVMYAINHDDPDYQMLSNHIKDTFYVFPKGDGTFYKIPKPRETGSIFGAGVERALRIMQAEDPDGFKDFFATLKTSFFPPIRTVIAPFNDIRANKNFADLPIVPRDLEKLSPELQYDQRTSEVSKKLGGLINASPKKLDYLIKSYGGVIGQVGLPIATKDTGFLEMLKHQVTTDPAFSNDASNEFYDKKEKLDRAYSDFKVKGVNSSELDNAERLKMNRISDIISGYRKQMKQVEADKTLDSDERQKKLRVLQLLIVKTEREAVGNK